MAGIEIKKEKIKKIQPVIMTKAEKRAARRARFSAWLREDTTPVTLCKGASIDSGVYEISENRYITLVIKGIIVYFLTAGAFGSYLTAMNIDFNQLIFNAVIFMTAVLCAILYHSWKSENLGYLVFFVFYAGILFLFHDYINSGFYAVINDTIKRASDYFDTEGMQYYNERINNRYVAITISMSLIGVAINILLNNYILRRARYMVAVFLTISVNLIAFFMQREPDTLYSFMMLAGIIMTYVMKSGGHYWLSRNDHVFEKTKKGLDYSIDWKGLLQGMTITVIFVAIITAGVNVFQKKETYDILQPENAYKTASRENAQNFIMLGFSGMFNFYPNNGGLSSGELGGVSTIRLDYNTDLNVEFTPYTSNRIYIKNFIGQKYIPFENRWEQPASFNDASEQNEHEASALEDAYESGESNTAKGIMKITNVAATPLPYYPYYTKTSQNILSTGASETVTYYPKLAGNETKVSSFKVNNEYLTVPDDNRAAIEEFIRKAQITDKDSPEEVIAKIKAYYQDNIPYTIRPGATPQKSDFINYFLKKNKKGYCAHFASAATLCFRYMGIPARYCEGYAIDFSDVTGKGTILGGSDYADYYSGDNEIGKTALVSVNATDANAHAWVEVYIDGKGWTVADVTPYSTSEENDASESFWEMFNNILGDGGNGNTETAKPVGNSGGFSIHMSDTVTKFISQILAGLIIISGFIFAVIKIYPTLKYHKEYRGAGFSDKLIMKYSLLAATFRKKDRKFRKKMNFRDQMYYIYALTEYNHEKIKDNTKDDIKYETKYEIKDESIEKLIQILEQAGFSNNDISEMDFEFALDKYTEMFEKLREYRKKHKITGNSVNKKI